MIPECSLFYAFYSESSGVFYYDVVLAVLDVTYLHVAITEPESFDHTVRGRR